MGTTQSTTLNADSAGKATSGNYGNLGDGSSDWFNYLRAKDGGIVAIGSTTDASTPTGNGSVIGLLKALRGFFLAEDAAHASGDVGLQMLGVRNEGLATRTSADGDYAHLAVGPSGETFTTLSPPIGTTVPASVALTELTGGALVASAVIKNSAGVIYRLSGINNNAAIRYIQLFNLAAVPADGVAPSFVYQVAPTSSFSIDFGVFGRRHSTGICICTSTTLATKTIGAADMWFNAGIR